MARRHRSLDRRLVESLEAIAAPRSHARRDGEHGQIVVLFALAMVVVLGCAALVVDVGLLRSDKVRVQTAIDAATLAGAHYLPATSATGASNYANIRAVAGNYATANMPGLATTTSFRCVVGLASPGVPRISDMPSACKVSLTATSPLWQCSDELCWAPCDPATTTTDVCNTIAVTADASRQLTFGGIFGLAAASTSGDVGPTRSAACNGLCGASPSVPLDLVVLVDRTSSMGGAMPDSTAVAGLRAGARAVLGAYNPDIQRIAFGALGPSTIGSVSPADSSNTIACLGTPAVKVASMAVGTAGVTYKATSSATNVQRQITRVASNSGSTSATATSLTISTPSGTLSGHVMIATLVVNGVSSVPTPSGWTLINSTSNGSAVTMASFYQRLTAAPAASYTFNFSGGTSKYSGAAAIVTYSGVDTSTATAPLDVAGADASGSNKNIAAGSLTTTGAASQVIGVYVHSGTSTITKPSAMTEILAKSASSGPGPMLELAEMSQAAAGSTGNQTATTGSNVTWAAHLFALKAAASTSTSLAIPVPTNAADDVLVAAITATGGTGAAITAPSGWTSIRRTNNSTTLAMATFYHVVSATESGNATWTVSGSAVGTISSYSDVDTASVIDPAGSAGSYGTGATGSGTSAAATAISTGAGYSQLVGAYAITGATTWTKPSALTERADTQFPTSGPTLEFADGSQTAAGSSGTQTATAAATGSWIAQLTALRARAAETYSVDVTNATALSQWIPVGFSGLDTATPALGGTGSGGYQESYSSNGTYTASSHLGQAIDCFDQSGTGTNLATPIDMAVKYLQLYGRPNARRGIIIETDGAPSSCPAGLPTATCDKFTSAAAQASADAAKNAGVTLFTIGYGSANPTLLGTMASTLVGTSTCTAVENTDGDTFFCAPTASDLTTVFTAAAQALAAGPHLVKLYAQPTVTSISPASGSKAGGTRVTVTGTGYGDAFSVKVGGTAASFDIVSDTSLVVTIPASATTGTVDIVVAGLGGSSPVVNGDKFTYTP